MMQNKETVRSFVEEVFGRGNLDAVDRLLTPDYVNHNPMPGQDPGPAGEKQRATTFRSAFPDLRVTVEDMVAEGDRVSARLTIRGTQRGEFMRIPPTGKQVSWQAMVIYRTANGRLAERWGTHDFLALLQQLGVIEMEAMPAAR